MRKLITVVAVLVSALLAPPAIAYVGPGAGITLLGALWAVVAAVVLAVMGVMIWPLRLLWRRLKGAKPAEKTPARAEAPASNEPSNKP